MPPRRLRIVSSSDEDDDDDNDVVSQVAERNVVITDGDTEDGNSIEVDLQSVTLNSSNTPENHPRLSRQPPSPIPLDISSDDDYMPTGVNMSNPNPNPDPNNSNVSEQVPVPDGSVSGILRRLGLYLRREWLDSCLIGLDNAVPGFSNLDNSQKAKLCFEQFLNADMNHRGAGVLPENLHSLHLVDLKGPFVLQVDEVVNISCPLRGRYQKAPPGIKRCLKLSMTDGVQRVFGMEYRPINALDVFSPAGLKVAVCNVNVRRGLLMLVPEAFEVLGGMVEVLEAARQRLVQEVNKPPRGKRTRTGVIPSLATRATLAAWPRDNVSDAVHINNSQMESNVRLQTDEQGTAFETPIRDRTREHIAVPSLQESEPNPLSAAAVNGTASSIPGNDRAREDIAPFNFSDGTETVSLRTASGAPVNQRIREDIAPCSRNDGTETNSDVAAMDTEEIHIVNELESPYILSGDKELPFTYMASLLSMWAAMKDKVPFVQGKIKCFLTGVKGFRYKERATFELRVFIDDGSLISEILIDHNVVQKGIGHSPQEVTAALASSDSKLVSGTKEKLKQFQQFLANFEGVMVIKMNRGCGLPVATEMEQGSAASDAWLLLKRLQSSSASPPAPTQHHPINLSP